MANLFKKENVERATTSGWTIGADTAGRADAIVLNSGGKSYIKWSQEQVGPGTGIWPFLGRYLVRIDNVNEGLTTESNGVFTPTGELSTIFDNGTAVVLIDNRGTNLGWGTNGANGSADAQKAKAAASALGIPNDMYIFVDVETNISSLGNYLANYKATLESGTVKYKMGVYFSLSAFETINSQFDLSNTYTWVAKWESDLDYPNWPTDFSPAVSDKGIVKIWQFIRDQYETDTNHGSTKLDLNIIMDSYSGMIKYMYHPYF